MNKPGTQRVPRTTAFNSHYFVSEARKMRCVLLCCLLLVATTSTHAVEPALPAPQAVNAHQALDIRPLSVQVFSPSQDTLSHPHSRSVHDWPTFSHDNAHSGYSDTTAPATNNVLWTYTTGGDIDSSPAVVAGLVYFGSFDAIVYCLNAETGALVWTYETEGLIQSSPAVAGGKVYIGSFDCNLYCLDAGTGSYLWSYEAAGCVYSPTVDNGKVYFGIGNDRLYCLNADTGSFIWSYFTGETIKSCPAVDDGKVYFGSHDDNMYCLDANTGAFIWSYPTLADVYGAPTVVYNKVFFVSTDRTFYSLHADEGYVWNTYTFDGSNGYETCPAVCLSGKVYVGTHSQEKLYLFNTQLQEQWSSYTGCSSRSSPAVANGKVYIGGGYRVYCFDAYTGDEIWNYQTGGAVQGSPAISDGRVYVGSWDNKLYCFGDPPMPPVADFHWTPEYPVIGEPVAFDASDSHDPDGSITLYEWDWDNNGIYDESYTTPYATHEWENADDYPITLRVTDDELLPGTVTKTVSVGSGSDPSTPSNPSPEDVAVNVSGDADLSWDGGDADPYDSVTYSIYFGTDPSPPFVESVGPYPATQTRITYAVELGSMTTYYWKVEACDNHEHCSEGPVWSFTTAEFQPSIAYSPSSLTNECEEGQDASDQTCEVWNEGGGMLEYSITVEDDWPEGDWLWVDPPDGTSQGEHNTHTVHYNTASLACGDYSAAIVISDPEANNNPQTIPVELTVTGQASIGLDTYLLTPECQEGEEAPGQTFDVWNAGKCTLDYTITVEYQPPGIEWILPIDPPGGTLGGEDDPVTHTVSYSTAGLACSPDPYQATITISDPEADNDPQIINVELTVFCTYMVGGTIFDDCADPSGSGVGDVLVTVEGDGGTFTTYSSAVYWGTWQIYDVPCGTYTVTPSTEDLAFCDVETLEDCPPDPCYSPRQIIVSEENQQANQNTMFLAISSVGACCFSPSGCVNLTESDCDMAGGFWEGLGTECGVGGACSGACCLSSGGCLELVEADCDVIPETTWQGFGSDCVDGNGNGIADDCELPGDLDGDGDVDIDDYALFAGCMTGPDGGIDPGCELADLDADTDVDLEDFAIFQNAFAGSGG